MELEVLWDVPENNNNWLLLWDSAGGMDHESPVCLLLMGDLFQWQCTPVSLPSVLRFKAPKAGNVPAAFGQSVCVPLSMAPGRNS